MPETFLPTNYEVPQTSGKYMKFQIGENRFRILGRPIIGNEGWHEDGNGRKPIRKRTSEVFRVDEVDPETIKHFWAMPVWSYRDRRVQVLEITQKTVMRALENLSKDSDWGSPAGYDIVVSRIGEKLETEYSVTPKPKSGLDPEAMAAWKEIKPTFDLERLFDNGDPFGDTGPSQAPTEKPKERSHAADVMAEAGAPVAQPKPAEEEEINVEDIPF